MGVVENNEALPPDWAIQRAIDECNSGLTVRETKEMFEGGACTPFCDLLIAHAHLIAKHETPPVAVDSDVQLVADIVNAFFEESARKQPMTEALPPDWALEVAIERSGVWLLSVGPVRARLLSGQECDNVVLALAELARTIAKYEQPPVDPLLQRAREIWASEYESYRAGNDTYFSSRIRNGDEDSAFAMTMLLRALREGIELGEAK